MKVLMFGWEFPPHNSGGLGVACHGLAHSLVGNGVDVLFVLPKRLDLTEERIKFIFADVPEVKVKEVDSLLAGYITSGKYASLRSKVRSTLYGAGLFEEVERYALLAEDIADGSGFDVIHAHDWLSFGAGIVAKKTTGKPLVVHVHATEYDRTGGNGINKHVYGREKEGMEVADKVVTVSDLTKNLIVKHYGINPRKIETVHNGIDTDNYQIKARADSGLRKLKKAGYKIVLSVGRITLQKGIDHLMYAAKVVLEHDPKVIFVIVGSGDMEGQIMQQAASLGISDKVLFPGFLRGKQMSEAYRAADLFIMPSVSEPFGLVALEALVHGAPVIISKQSGASETIRNAMKVDFWDAKEMADQILSVLEYKSLQKDMAINGSKEAFRQNWDVAAKDVISIYNSL